MSGSVYYRKCNPEARAQRQQQIADLRAKIASGITSVADRGRSVSYNNPQWMWNILQSLEAEEDYCDGVRRGMRMIYVPMCRG